MLTPAADCFCRFENYAIQIDQVPIEFINQQLIAKKDGTVPLAVLTGQFDHMPLEEKLACLNQSERMAIVHQIKLPEVTRLFFTSLKAQTSTQKIPAVIRSKLILESIAADYTCFPQLNVWKLLSWRLLANFKQVEQHFQLAVVSIKNGLALPTHAVRIIVAGLNELEEKLLTVLIGGEICFYADDSNIEHTTAYRKTLENTLAAIQALKLQTTSTEILASIEKIEKDIELFQIIIDFPTHLIPLLLVPLGIHQYHIDFTRLAEISEYALVYAEKRLKHTYTLYETIPNNLRKVRNSSRDTTTKLRLLPLIKQAEHLRDSFKTLQNMLVSMLHGPLNQFAHDCRSLMTRATAGNLQWLLDFKSRLVKWEALQKQMNAMQLEYEKFRQQNADLMLAFQAHSEKFGPLEESYTVEQQGFVAITCDLHTALHFHCLSTVNCIDKCFHSNINFLLYANKRLEAAEACLPPQLMKLTASEFNRCDLFQYALLQEYTTLIDSVETRNRPLMLDLAKLQTDAYHNFKLLRNLQAEQMTSSADVNVPSLCQFSESCLQAEHFLAALDPSNADLHLTAADKLTLQRLLAMNNAWLSLLSCGLAIPFLSAPLGCTPPGQCQDESRFVAQMLNHLLRSYQVNYTEMQQALQQYKDKLYQRQLQALAATHPSAVAETRLMLHRYAVTIVHLKPLCIFKALTLNKGNQAVDQKAFYALAAALLQSYREIGQLYNSWEVMTEFKSYKFVQAGMQGLESELLAPMLIVEKYFNTLKLLQTPPAVKCRPRPYVVKTPTNAKVSSKPRKNTPVTSPSTRLAVILQEATRQCQRIAIQWSQPLAANQAAVGQMVLDHVQQLSWQLHTLQELVLVSTASHCATTSQAMHYLLKLAIVNEQAGKLALLAQNHVPSERALQVSKSHNPMAIYEQLLQAGRITEGSTLLQPAIVQQLQYMDDFIALSSRYLVDDHPWWLNLDESLEKAASQDETWDNIARCAMESMTGFLNCIPRPAPTASLLELESSVDSILQGLEQNAGWSLKNYQEVTSYDALVAACTKIERALLGVKPRQVLQVSPHETYAAKSKRLKRLKFNLHALQASQDAFMQLLEEPQKVAWCASYSEAILLRGAVLMETALLSLLYCLPAASKGQIEHMLLAPTEKDKTPLAFSHRLVSYAEACVRALKELKCHEDAKILEDIASRSSSLELVIKQLYRYPCTPISDPMADTLRLFHAFSTLRRHVQEGTLTASEIERCTSLLAASDTKNLATTLDKAIAEQMEVHLFTPLAVACRDAADLLNILTHHLL